LALLKILEFPDPRLRTVAKPVVKIDDILLKLIDDMLETMYAAPGIGLAATQINVHKRVLVMDVTEEKNSPMSFINPEIEIIDAELGEFSEGCLSVPGFFEIVNRPKSVRVKSLDSNSKEKIQELEGLSAICLQHEVDHLNGKLFVDYISPLKRGLIRKKLQKAQKQRT
tara:strand:+ start:171 stop:677 length:507 start_codon:yes stop_codon:yes gene_type:complete